VGNLDSPDIYMFKEALADESSPSSPFEKHDKAQLAAMN